MFGNEDNDEIYGSEGSDIIRGMSGIDTIDGGLERDVLFGEDGEVLNAAAGAMLAEDMYDLNNVFMVRTIVSTDTTVSDDIITDTMGDNIIIAGLGQDTVTTGDDDDVIIGDNGQITFSTAGLIETLVITDLTNGTKDIIDAGNGNNIIAGATGDDEIDTGTGDDIILGDGGTLEFVGGVLVRASATSSTQGHNIITVAGGDNLILAGAGMDTVTTGGGEDLILGDTGTVVYEAGLLKSATTSNQGGEADNITSGAGADIVLAGLGSDVIDTGADDDIVIADTGTIEKDPTGNPATLIKNDADPTLGGDDIVDLGDGNDIALGGAGSDTLRGEVGEDALFGDFVEININQAGVRDFQSILPTAVER